MSKDKAELFDVAAYQTELAEWKALKLKPIKDQIVKLQAQRRAIDDQLNALNSLEAQIEGRSVSKGGKKAPSVSKSKDEMLALGQGLYDLLRKSKGNPHKPEDMAGHAGGVTIAKLVKTWNEAQEEKGKQIQRKGAGRATRYLLPA